MKILAADTSGQSVSVALMVDNMLVYECTQSNGLTHSENLMPLIDAAMRVGRVVPSDIDRFAVVTGPGSFTGVRIGVAAMKAMAQVVDRTCVGVNALRALAFDFSAFPGFVCAMRDARAGQAYCAVFQNGRYLLEDSALSIDELLDKIAPLGACCFVGDGADAYHDQILQKMGQSAFFPPRLLGILRASNAALLAIDAETVDFRQLTPYYLRAPQAERERLAREAQR